jgi:CO/xanthine dehydrogenase Mo-binding subunit
VAKFFGLPNNNVRLIFSEGSGSYGQNLNDDVTLDAAIMSRGVGGKPVRLQLMRGDEHGWDNYLSATLFDVSAAVDANGRMLAWKSESWAFAGLNRPSTNASYGEPGSLTVAKLAGWTGFAAEQGALSFAASTPYDVPNAFAKYNDLGPGAHRQVSTYPKPGIQIATSSLRAIASVPRTFAVESVTDELAALAGVDPLAFRMNHVSDPRQIAVLQAAANRAGWQPRVGPNPNRAKGGILTGRGVALGGRAAWIVDVSVDTTTGKISVPHVTVALDAGLHVNPNGIENQLEGGVIHGISRALWEQVTWNGSTITSRDWVTYPILRFKDAPKIDIVLLPHQDQPADGAGEPGHSGIPAALANAFTDATGVRIRQLPLTPRRVRAALKAAGLK